MYEDCRDDRDIRLVIGKQPQGVRGQLLHRTIKTSSRRSPYLCVTALRHRYRPQETAREEAAEA
ncbi:hypothetical protein ACIODS_16570 [Micromonospora chalcea]|uniref:hypothetical protein n=1 Tax=Micromonospora chalcea TaxID=1874 RepID=UPI0038232F65